MIWVLVLLWIQGGVEFWAALVVEKPLQRAVSMAVGAANLIAAAYLSGWFR